MSGRPGRGAARGFTLVEVMVVVAILGVLATLAIVYVRPSTRPADVATRFGALVQEASRTAVRYGMVRADVAAAQLSKRRTRITATAGPTPRFTLEVFVEQAAPSIGGVWYVVETFEVPAPVTGAAYAMVVGPYASVPIQTDWTTFVLDCYPSGACDAASLFFSSERGPTRDRKARVSVLPLGTASYVRTDWL